MKCISCGGEVASDQEKCPYCNTINKAAVENNKRISIKMFHNAKLKEKVLESSKEYRWNKILNRTILIMIFLFVFQFAAGFGAYYIAEYGMDSMHAPKDIMQQLETNYEKGNLNKLYNLVTKYDLEGPDYYKYIQIGLLNSNYESFLSSRNDCMEQIALAGIPDDYSLESTLKNGIDVLVPNFNSYKDIEGENQEILNEYQQSVNVFFQTYLKLEENEIRDLCSLKISSNILSEDINPTLKTIKERLSE